MFICHDIRVLITKQSRVQVSPSYLFEKKIKHKVVWARASFKPKGLSLEDVC